MERNWCRGGGADLTLHLTNGNNAEHSQGKLGNFIIEIEWEP